MTREYKRNGTVDLSAAMNIDTGELLHHTRRRHASTDVLAIFKWIDIHVLRNFDLHVVLDNLSARKPDSVRTWLADQKQAPWHLHRNPTWTSWLNLIKGCFSALKRKAFTNSS
jgi:transposase